MPTKIDEASSTVSYIGITNQGNTDAAPVWTIIKSTLVGTETSYEVPVGITPGRAVWDDRTTYTYE